MKTSVDLWTYTSSLYYRFYPFVCIYAICKLKGRLPVVGSKNVNLPLP